MGRGYFSEVLIAPNLVLRLQPMPLTAPMIASEIPAAIRPYSMAVAPDSSVRKRAKSLDMPSPLLKRRLEDGSEELQPAPQEDVLTRPLSFNQPRATNDNQDGLAAHSISGRLVRRLTARVSSSLFIPSASRVGGCALRNWPQRRSTR